MAGVEQALLSVWPRYRWTADDAASGVRLEGKTIVVTGATSGIGIPTALALARTGAKVVITARDAARGEATVEKIRQESGNSNVSVRALDLTSFASVRQFASEFLATGDAIHALVHNAGVMALPFQLTADGYETQLQVNYLSIVLLTKLLLPALIAGQPSRVVVVSSIAHKRVEARTTDLTSFLNWNDAGTYDKWVSYGAAKSAVILFVNELQRQFQSHGLRITANSVHPGGIMTGLQVSLTPEEMQGLGWVDANGNVNPGFKTVEQGGSTTVYAAVSSELEGRGGLYLENCGAVDPSAKLEGLAAMAGGTVPHVWNEDQARKLWATTTERLGLTSYFE